MWSMTPVPADLAGAIAATGATLRQSNRDELVAVRRLAVAEAAHRGLDADTPTHLSRSVILES